MCTGDGEIDCTALVSQADPPLGIGQGRALDVEQPLPEEITTGE